MNKSFNRFRTILAILRENELPHTQENVNAFDQFQTEDDFESFYEIDEIVCGIKGNMEESILYNFKQRKLAFLELRTFFGLNPNDESMDEYFVKYPPMELLSAHLGERIGVLTYGEIKRVLDNLSFININSKGEML